MRRVFDEAEKQRIRELHEKGLDVKAISERTGRNINTIYKVLGRVRKPKPTLAIAFMVLFSLTPAHADNFRALDVPISVKLISRAEYIERLCQQGDAESCAMIEAASGDDDILNRPLTYGETPQEIYEYFGKGQYPLADKGSETIVNVEVYE